jgi:hypothetical protein
MPVLSTLGAAIANVYGFTSGLIKDQYFNLVSLLLPGNGTNGATNNSFVDSSTANGGTGWPITRNGDTTQGTFSPFSQTGWGAYFDGSNDYVSVANSAALDLSTADFCIGFWVYLTAGGTFRRVMQWQNGSASNSNYGYAIHIESSNQVSLRCFSGTTGYIITNNTSALQISAWNWVCVTRSGTSGNVYVNGTGVSGTTPTTINNPTSSLLYISGDLGSSDPLLGYLSGLQIVKGSTTALSTTAPTSPYTAVSGTSLLTFQYNRFRDASSNTLTVTPNNGAAITPFSPFAPTSSYSAAAVGGSGYFDGSGDSLTTPNVTALNLYNTTNTVECWVYPLSFSSDMQIYGTDFDGTYYTVWRINGTTGYPRYLSRNGTSIAGSTGLTLNQWNHVAWGRSGTTVSIWLNGTRVANGTITTEDQWGTGVITTGRFNNGDYLNGYLSGLRVVKGSDVYGVSNTSITVPTAPFTAITNTAYLLNFTNAGVVDATAKNVLETEGNAQISTAQSKWGGGSMRFPQSGTSDYLYKPYDVLLNQLSGNFTMECWIYPTATSTRMVFAGSISAAGSDNWLWEITSANKLSFTFSIGGSSVTATSTASISQNTWTYVAVVRNGGTLTQYINGSSDGTASPTAGAYRNASFGFAIGRGGDYNGLYYTGYVDDFRITIGQARTITASPTAPFPVQ